MVARIELGDPAPNGGIEREYLSLRLAYGDQSLTSRGWSGWFEDELADLGRQMPEGTYVKACIACAFSDYSPVGHGLFGGLACFRGNKAAYRAVRSKSDLFRTWGTLTGFVQETYLCPEFERRAPETATGADRAVARPRLSPPVHRLVMPPAVLARIGGSTAPGRATTSSVRTRCERPGSRPPERVRG